MVIKVRRRTQDEAEARTKIIIIIFIIKMKLKVFKNIIIKNEAEARKNFSTISINVPKSDVWMVSECAESATPPIRTRGWRW